ncbi:MAG: hypothetical protein JSU04_12555 [Bdellovibrionales bacterium]|nr:hypothetical protein [Bdellovibrionales bacterium]
MKSLVFFLFVAIPSFALASQQISTKAIPENGFLVRLSYLDIGQNNGGHLSTGVVESGVRGWFNPSYYYAGVIGAYPLQLDDKEGNVVGGTFSLGLGWSWDRKILLESGLDYHTWGGAINATTGLYGKIIMPFKTDGSTDFFIGLSVFGSTAPIAPQSLIQLGISQVFK